MTYISLQGKNDDGECDAMTCCQFGNDQCLKNRKNGGCNHGGALYWYFFLHSFIFYVEVN